MCHIQHCIAYYKVNMLTFGYILEVVDLKFRLLSEMLRFLLCYTSKMFSHHSQLAMLNG